MKIIEHINERSLTDRIEYVFDGLPDVKVMQSHGYSTLYMLKLQQLKDRYPLALYNTLQIRVNRYLEAYHKPKMWKVE
jgi:ABC-type arginine transport system ATPase subunit